MYNYSIIVDYENDQDYQRQFLQTLNLKSYDNDKINKVFDFLFLKIKDSLYFEKIFKKNYTNSFLGKDKWSIIPILFASNSFKFSHICFKEFLTTNKVSQKNIDALEMSLNYLI